MGLRRRSFASGYPGQAVAVAPAVLIALMRFSDSA